MRGYRYISWRLPNGAMVTEPYTPIFDFVAKIIFRLFLLAFVVYAVAALLDMSIYKSVAVNEEHLGAAAPGIVIALFFAWRWHLIARSTRLARWVRRTALRIVSGKSAQDTDTVVPFRRKMKG